MNDLDTAYSKMFESLMEDISDEYIKLLRELLAGKLENARRNATDMAEFWEKLKAIREKLNTSKILSKPIDAMKSVFETIDKRIVKGIQKQFAARKFNIPKLKPRTVALDAAVKANVELIKGIKDKQAELLENVVMKAAKGTGSLNDIVKEVQEQSDKGIAYAKFVARDQLSKAHKEMDEERAKDVGFPGYFWECMKDNRTRPSHRAMNGEYVYWDKPPLIDGRHLHAGEDYQCRCIRIPGFDPSEELPNPFDNVRSKL